MRNSYYEEEYRLHLPYSQVRKLLFPRWDEIIDEADGWDEPSGYCPELGLEDPAEPELEEPAC